ncbi:hypothetical protein [uncultured Desulfobacter sp.]|uniref:hypothetical protein n=1 Tax=uncultured Desulfobacter sp. TaxID=240139 RepID=UPI002AAB5B4F|nr:hypothetical protein [uncultured Desulfobacter sp.]
MADLIENGLFETTELSPWEWCSATELGDTWACLEAAEPGFDRWHGVYTRKGGITDENWVFISDYNLVLKENDAVVQQLPSGSRADGDLTLWATNAPMDYAWGDLYVFICYRDRTFNYQKVTTHMLFERTGPYFLRMPVEDKNIKKIVLCVTNASHWYVNDISLPGVETPFEKHFSFLRFFRAARHLEKRVSFLEKKIDKMQRVLVKRPFMIESKLKENTNDLTEK